MMEQNLEQFLREYEEYLAKEAVTQNEGSSMTSKRNDDNKISYSDIVSVDNLKKSYERTKSGVAPGLDGETKAKITDKRLQKLESDLKNQKYAPRATKRVNVLKPDGGTRSLGIASQIDKVVQAAILLQIEPVLDKMFSECSFGFRPGRGCHDALKIMKTKWQSVTWIINADISKCFDKIHHDLLLRLLSNHCDQATVELVRKLLKAGYIDIHNLNDRTEYNVAGTPQASLISPIFCNLFLHELDIFLQYCQSKYNKGIEREYLDAWKQRGKLSDDDKDILKKYPELKRSIRTAKHRRRVIDMKTSRDPDDPGFRRLHFVRYADDFILGFCGPKNEAEFIMKLIDGFLQTKLQLDLDETKSKIHHSGDRGIKYLGCYIRYINTDKVTTKNYPVKDKVDQVTELKNTATNSMQMRAPIDTLMKKAVDRKCAKFRKDGSVRATSCQKISFLTDADIVRYFSSIIRRILNYYSFVNQRSDLWSVVSLYRKSCALTLANKHKLRTASKAFRKYGPKLKVQPEKIGGEVVELYYPSTLKSKTDFKTGKACIQTLGFDHLLGSLQRSYKHNPITGDICEYEGCKVTTGLESHLINPQVSFSRKDLTRFEKKLIANKRKIVMLCGKHHKRFHTRKLLVDDK
jgi:group II intron reverse transcriptase/maturase